MKILDKIIHLFYPLHYTCIFCGEEINSSIDVCEHCLKTLPYMSGNLCLRCGQHIKDESEYCDNCKASRTPFHFDLCRAVFVYTYPITRIIRSIKYDNTKYMFPTLGQFLTHLYEENELSADVIVPIPLHPKRLKQRKYNQAEELARQLSEAHGLPIDNDHLFRVVDTPSQTKYQTKGRSKNVKDAFDIDIRNLYKDKIVLLIDDVITSGATINECARVLKEKGGATQVIALTLAHSPVRDTRKKIK